MSPEVTFLKFTYDVSFQNGTLTLASSRLYSPSDSTHATPRLDTASASMDVDRTEPNFEGKAIFNALENAVQRRRNKRKRSLEDISQCPRYHRHFLDSQSNAQSRVDGDGDAVMGGTAERSTPEVPLEAGEIVEVLPCPEYDMNVLSCEPKTSEEKTMFAKNLVYLLTDAAVTADRCRKAEKRYEAYKKSQEARIYNHPSYDARQVLVEKLQTLKGASHGENERFTRILADMGSLPSHHLSDVVGYNEHNNLAYEALAEERRRAVILEAEGRLKERHDQIDRNIISLKARLEELTKEKEAREVHRDTSPPVDPEEIAVEEALGLHQANVQRVVALESSLQTIASVEGSPNQTLENSLPTSDGHVAQLQELAEAIATLISQVPKVQGEIDVIKVENEQRKEAQKAHEEGSKVLDQRLVESSARLEALHSRVTGLLEGLKYELTIENVKTAVQPTLSEHTRAILEEVSEHIEFAVDRTRKEIHRERTRMEAHIYKRLLGTQRLFESVGGYLRAVRADLASLVDKDIGMSESS